MGLSLDGLTRIGGCEDSGMVRQPCVTLLPWVDDRDCSCAVALFAVRSEVAPCAHRSTERFEQVSRLRAAPGLRELFTSADVRDAYLHSLRTAESSNPWVHGFAAFSVNPRRSLAAAGFKGPPDEEGAVEIAYGIVPSYQGQGYAAEVAEALAPFASADPRVALLRAHTLPESNASTRDLGKLASSSWRRWSRTGLSGVGSAPASSIGPVLRTGSRTASDTGLGLPGASRHAAAGRQSRPSRSLMAGGTWLGNGACRTTDCVLRLYGGHPALHTT